VWLSRWVLNFFDDHTYLIKVIAVTFTAPGEATH
jgi:hypothetical protein